MTKTIHQPPFRLWVLVLAAALIGSIPSTAEAVKLEAHASQSHVSVGETVEVRIAVSGLGAGAAPSIGSYDLVLTYDPSAFTYEGYTPSRDLGAADLKSLIEGSVAGASTINFYGVSLLPDFDLLSSQDSTVVLVTAKFKAQTSGASAFGLTLNVLGDEHGQAIEPVQIVGASVVVAAESSVPAATMIARVTADAPVMRGAS